MSRAIVIRRGAVVSGCIEGLVTGNSNPLFGHTAGDIHCHADIIQARLVILGHPKFHDGPAHKSVCWLMARQPGRRFVNTYRGIAAFSVDEALKTAAAVRVHASARSAGHS